MVFILCFFDQLTSAYIIDVGRPILRPSDKVPIAVGNGESNLHVSVLVVACELSDGVSYSKVPKFDHVVSTTRQESVESIVVSEGALVKLNSVRMSLVAITHISDCLVRVGIINYKLLVRATYNAYS